MGYQKNEKGSIFSLQFPLITSPPHSFSLLMFRYNKFTVYWFQLFSLKQFPFCLALNVLSHFHYAITQVTSCYCQLDYIGIIRQLYCFIVNYCFHHVVTQDPGYGTKFVTFPSCILLEQF